MQVVYIRHSIREKGKKHLSKEGITLAQKVGQDHLLTSKGIITVQNFGST